MDVVVVKQRAESKRASKKGLTNADVAKIYVDKKMVYAEGGEVPTENFTSNALAIHKGILNDQDMRDIVFKLCMCQHF